MVEPIDPSKPMEPDRQLTPDDILRYWEEKGAKAECELCGHSGWRAHNEKGGYSAYLPIRTELSWRGSNETQHPVIFLSCDKCGNVRLINRVFVLSWLRNIKIDE